MSVEAGHAAHPPVAHQSSRVDARTLGMFLFIASEVMLFGSFFTAYFFVRVVNHQPWPPHPFHLPVFVAFVNTCILVTSSFTMHWALQSIKRGNRAGMQAGLTLTFLMGLTFLLTQLLEYARIGFTPHDQAFGTIFFCLTGLHGAHVFVGLIVAGALINRWLGLAVFIVLSAIVLFFYFRRGERQPRVLAPTRARTAEDERRILVIANETVGGETLRNTIRERSAGFRAHVLVVTPALNSPLR